MFSLENNFYHKVHKRGLILKYKEVRKEKEENYNKYTKKRKITCGFLSTKRKSSFVVFFENDDDDEDDNQN